MSARDLLSGLFYLMGLPGVDAGRRLAAAVVAGLFAEFGPVCVGDVVQVHCGDSAGGAVAYCIGNGGGSATRAARRLLPFFGAALVLALADLAFVRAREASAFDYALLERLLIAAQALWFYLGKLLWPVELAVIYPHWEVGAGNLAGWVCLFGAAALGGGSVGLEAALGAGAAGRDVVLWGDPVAGVGFGGLWLHAVFVCGGSLSVFGQRGSVDSVDWAGGAGDGAVARGVVRASRGRGPAVDGGRAGGGPC